jgi:hypothetical protein
MFQGLAPESYSMSEEYEDDMAALDLEGLAIDTELDLDGLGFARRWRRRPFGRALKRIRRQAAGRYRRGLPRRKTPGRRLFLKWIKRRNPRLFRTVMARVNAQRRMMGRTISTMTGLAAYDEYTPIMGAGRRNPVEYENMITNNNVSGLALDRELDLEGLDLENDELGGLWDDIVATVKNVAPTLVQTKAQLDIYKAQMKRAERGLPPLKTEEIAPTVRVQTEVGPETRREILGGMGKFAIPIAIGGGLLLMMMMQRKR